LAALLKKISAPQDSVLRRLPGTEIFVDMEEYPEAEPLPGCYAAPQRLARALIAAGSNGLVYPSVRRAGHTCLVCFRPALVYRPRRDIRLEIVFEAAEVGYEWRARTVGIQ